jgi:putative flavoprotein involved in K+ transport
MTTFQHHLPEQILDVVVIGGGQAGLATGYHLKQAGLRFVLLEGADQVGGSWPRYYDSLQLFSPARYSSLPGLPFPGNPDHYPLRDEVADYLRRYAAHFWLPVVTRARVQGVQRHDEQFAVHVANGTVYRCRALICATGSVEEPHLPDVAGRSEFSGQVLHSRDYRHPEPFAGQRVVVVGGGNSGVQIAVELAGVARVSLAVRRRVWFVPQRLLGCDLHFWLRWTGLDYLRLFKDHGTPLVVDAGKYRQAIKQNRPQQRPMFRRFTRAGVLWEDATEEALDVVIFATGYRPRLTYLAGLDVLDSDGQVQQRGGVSTTVAGLYFVGLSGQRNFASATLRGVGPDAERVVRHIQRSSRSRGLLDCCG